MNVSAKFLENQIAVSDDFVIKFALFGLHQSLDLAKTFVQNATLLNGSALLVGQLLPSPDPFSRLLHFHGHIPLDALFPGSYIVAPNSVVYDVIGQVDLAVVLQEVNELRRIKDGRQ